MPGVVKLLHEVDGQLGLAVHRGEGHRDEWMREASDLITRVRKAIPGVESVVALHQPSDEEIEVWIDDDSGLHAEHFRECTDCNGHTLGIQVCRECGYEHNGEFPTFRRWPCPTIRALNDLEGDR